MANKSFVVQYIIKARERFSQSANKVRRSSDAMRKSIDRAKKSFVEFSAKARKAGLIMTAAVTTPILFMARSLKNAARDAQETQSKFNTVFSSLEGRANKTAVAFGASFGLANEQAQRLLANTGDLLTGFGFTQEAAFNLSSQVNELAADLASFQNLEGGVERASHAITSALTGEREALKSLGIVVNEENLKKKILAMRSDGVRFASKQEAKALATVALAMEQSKNAIGDVARTKHDLANQERFLAANTANLSVEFGQILVPIFLKLTGVLLDVTRWVNALSPGMKKMILIVVGVAAVIGPLLLILGSVALVLPVLASGAAIVGTVLGVIAVAAGALTTVVSVLGTAFMLAFGPVGLIVVGLAAAAFLVIDNWTAVKDFFINMWATIKDKVALLSGIFGGGSAEIGGGSLNVLGQSRVDVGVNVGLDKGLKQTSEPTKRTRGGRRTDVGSATGGA